MMEVNLRNHRALPNNGLQLTMEICNGRHLDLKCVRHLGGRLVVQEKLNGAALTFVRCELNFHLLLDFANAGDLQVRMPRVVRRFEVKRRTELVSQY
jgi:hypothetical protein